MNEQAVIIEEGELTLEQLRGFKLFEHNFKWFSDHALELQLADRYRGRFVAVAGEELFVADTPEVERLAEEKHPGSHPFVHYIFKEKGVASL